MKPYLDHRIPDGEIGRGSPPYWPLVSRDLNPLYCYDGVRGRGGHQRSVLPVEGDTRCLRAPSQSECCRSCTGNSKD
jgi:hypothetical protein